MGERKKGIIVVSKMGIKLGCSETYQRIKGEIDAILSETRGTQHSLF